MVQGYYLFEFQVFEVRLNQEGKNMKKTEKT
jgi:hypothetical protein